MEVSCDARFGLFIKTRFVCVALSWSVDQLAQPGYPLVSGSPVLRLKVPAQVYLASKLPTISYQIEP